VRFGQEIAGKMELGLAGRGRGEIVAFVNQMLESELSGNMIDLCPSAPDLRAVRTRATGSCRGASRFRRTMASLEPRVQVSSRA